MKSVEDIKKYFENHQIYSWGIIIFLATSFLTSWASGCLDLKEKFFPKEDKENTIIEKEFDYSKLKPTVDVAPKDIMRELIYGVEKEVLLLKLGYPTKKEQIDSLRILNLEWLTRNVSIQATFYNNKLIFAELKIDVYEKNNFDLYLYETKIKSLKPFGSLIFKDVMGDAFSYFEIGDYHRIGKKLSSRYEPIGSRHFYYYFSTNYNNDYGKKMFNNKISSISIEPDYNTMINGIFEKIFEEIRNTHYCHYEDESLSEEELIKSNKEEYNEFQNNN
jgi:hypothetical protein